MHFEEPNLLTDTAIAVALVALAAGTLVGVGVSVYLWGEAATCNEMARRGYRETQVTFSTGCLVKTGDDWLTADDVLRRKQ